MIMVTIIGKRTEIAWISDFFDPEPKKIKTVIDKRTGIETEIKNWIQPLIVTEPKFQSESLVLITES